MDINLLTYEDMVRLKEEILENIKALLTANPPSVNNKWLRSSEVCKYLGISKSSLQNLRQNGYLPYSQISGTLYYRLKDIDSILENNMQNERKDDSTYNELKP